MRYKLRAGLVGTVLALVAATCVVVAPGLVGTSVAGASQVPLNLANEQGMLWPCTFNPFNPSSSPYSVGVTYETLDFINSLQNGKVTPWLATNYAWSNGDRTLTFTIRSGVKWSDGVPFSAADVAYTFNLLKKYPALDTNAVWSVLSSVHQVGATKVVFDFKAPAVPYFYYVADQVPIVPQHIWSKIANPVTDPISNPIGTGGYLMSKCTPQNIQWTANPHYWQKGKAQVKTVNMPAFLTNNTCNEYLATGQSQWGAQFIPNIKSYYVAKKPGNSYWFPPVANVSLFPNLKSAPLNSLAVRQAISYAIDRPRVSKIGEYGYEPPASQVGIVAPTFKSWVNPAASKAVGASYNPTKAKALLKAAGREDLSVTLVTAAVAQGTISAAQVFAQQAAAAGVKVGLDEVNVTEFYGTNYLKWPFAQDYWYYALYLPQVSDATLPTSPFNECHFDDPRYNQLYAEALRTVDRQKRTDIVHEMQLIDYDQGGYIIPYFPPVIDGYASDVHGLRPSKVGVSLGNYDFSRVWKS